MASREDSRMNSFPASKPPASKPLTLSLAPAQPRVANQEQESDQSFGRSSAAAASGGLVAGLKEIAAGTSRDFDSPQPASRSVIALSNEDKEKIRASSVHGTASLRFFESVRSEFEARNFSTEDVKLLLHDAAPSAEPAMKALLRTYDPLRQAGFEHDEILLFARKSSHWAARPMDRLVENVSQLRALFKPAELMNVVLACGRDGCSTDTILSAYRHLASLGFSRESFMHIVSKNGPQRLRAVDASSERLLELGFSKPQIEAMVTSHGFGPYLLEVVVELTHALEALGFTREGIVSMASNGTVGLRHVCEVCPALKALGFTPEDIVPMATAHSNSKELFGELLEVHPQLDSFGFTPQELALIFSRSATLRPSRLLSTCEELRKAGHLRRKIVELLVAPDPQELDDELRKASNAMRARLARSSGKAPSQPMRAGTAEESRDPRKRYMRLNP
jgi:TAL effector repeat